MRAGLSHGAARSRVWANPWHAAVVAGVDPDDIDRVWGTSARGGEAVAVLGAAAMATSFWAFIRVRFTCFAVIPVCALSSYVLMLVALGSPEPEWIPHNLGALALLLVLPMGASTRQEEALQRGDSFTEKVEKAEKAEKGDLPSREYSGMTGVTSIPSDITFHLSRNFTLTKTNCAVHDPFFGQRAEGLPFTRMLACMDRLRFQELIDAACTSKQREYANMTLLLPGGPLPVALSAEQAEPNVADGDGDFVIGVTVIDHPDLELSTFDRGRQVSGGRIPTVPEDLPISTVPGSVLDVAPEVLDFPPRSMGSLPFMGVCPSDTSLFHFSDISEVFPDTACNVHRRMSANATIATQTDPLVQRVDMGVNTTIVMDQFSFRCTTCSKPPSAPRYYSPDRCAPVLPGAHNMASKLDRSRRKRPGDPDQAHYRGGEYNGFWEAFSPCDPPPNMWLRQLCIFEGQALLGDDTEACLVQVGGADGGVFLCGGELKLGCDGCLERIGQSGSSVWFRLKGRCEDLDTEDCGEEPDRATFQRR